MHKVTATYMAQIVLTKGILMLSQTVIRGILESKKFEQIHYLFIHSFIFIYSSIYIFVHFCLFIYCSSTLNYTKFKSYLWSIVYADNINILVFPSS